MAALWKVHRKIMKNGTIIVDAMKSNMTNFGVSRTYFIVPPPVQKLNFPMVITFEAFILDIQFLVHLITLDKMIKFNITCHFKFTLFHFSHFKFDPIWATLNRILILLFVQTGRGVRGKNFWNICQKIMSFGGVHWQHILKVPETFTDNGNYHSEDIRL